MTENKTKATDASVADYLGAIADNTRRQDCQALAELMEKALGQAPKMWGPSIVGFGSYHYKYESGREGDACVVGFSSRKDAIAIYLVAEFEGKAELLAQLGKHKTGKGCLYLGSLSGVNMTVLEKLILQSAHQIKRNHEP